MRTVLVGAVVLAALAPALTAQQSGAFVVRLGTDTLSLEQYTRTATQLRGEYVIRAPRTRHRIYTADLNPDGTIRRFETTVDDTSKAVVEFVGDGAIITAPRGDSIVTTRMAVPKGTIPYTLHIYGLVEQIGRQARSTGRDSVAITVLSTGPATSGGYVRKRGGDTLVFNLTEGRLAGLGPFTFRLDRQGRLLWLTGRGSTVQVDVERVRSVPMAAATAAFATRPLGQLSVRDTARATVGGATVWVDYGRPMKRGREIFGALEPWNKVWRTGANAATQLSTSTDLVIGGTTVPAGIYSVWSLPSPTGWKLIINKQHGQWGTQYSADSDFARIDLKVETLPQPTEQFTIAFDPQGDGAVLRMEWDRTRVIVPVAKKP